MSILSWVIFGFIVGAAAKWIVPGKAPAGAPGDIVVGILGALFGGWLFHFFGNAGIGGLGNWRSWVMAVVGAVVLLRAARVLYERAKGVRGPTA